MNPDEALHHRISRFEVCMYMHENSFDFADQTNQDLAVLHFILQKHETLIENVKEAVAKNLRTAVHTFVQYLIKRYKANSKHIERLVEEDCMKKDIPNSLKNVLRS